MTQRRVPSAPDYPGSYVISRYHIAAGKVVFAEIVTDRLQRAYVAMPDAHTDAAEIDATIRHALAGLYRPPDPVQ